MKILITLVLSLAFLSVETAYCAQKRKLQSSSQAREGMLVELTGKIEYGILAIGGETTGTQLTTEKGDTYELLPDQVKIDGSKFKRGSLVKVKGVLSIFQSVEMQQRKLIKVSEIESVKPPKVPNSPSAPKKE